MKNIDRFLSLRKRLFRMIEYELNEDCLCKSYEGCLEITYEFPNYFEDWNAIAARPNFVMIKLHCYVVGPDRHYDWTGESLTEALNKFEKTIETWEECYGSASTSDS